MGDIFSRPSTWTTVGGTCHELGHTWHPSCLYSGVDFFLQVYLDSFARIYLPLFLVGNIIRRKSIADIIDASVSSAFRSSLFLAVNAGGFIGFICFLRKVLGKFYKYSVAFIPCMIASLFAIFVERKNRRGQLAGYVGAIAIETVYKMLKYREKVRPIPYGEVMIFSLATATFFSSYKSSKGLHDVVGSLLKVLFNPPGAFPRMLYKRSKGDGGLSTTLPSFLLHTAVVSMWGFVIGYSFQTILNVLQLGYRLVKKPGRIKQALTKPYNKQFGTFLAALTGFFNVLNSVMYIMSVPRDIRILISGLFAGLSMVFIRSTSISLYAACKAIELLFFEAVKKGYVRSYYYGDIILYCIFTPILFHAALFEAHNLRLSYWNFLNRISGDRIIRINYDVVDEFGTDASQFINIVRAQRQVEQRQK